MLSQAEHSTRPASNFIYTVSVAAGIAANPQACREIAKLSPSANVPIGPAADLRYDSRMLSPRSNFFARALLGLIAACTAGAAAPPAVRGNPPGPAPPQPSPPPAATTTTTTPAPAAAAVPAPDMLAAPMSGTE